MSENKKPRFILADPSAVHMGGHHYEYAARILQLAKDKGFEAELWAHKKADLPQNEFTVRTLFHKSFYENFSPNIGLSAFRNIESGSFFRNKLTGLYNRILNRSLPFFMETSMGLHAARAIHDASQNIFKPVYGSPQNKLKTPAISYFFFYVLYVTGREIKKSLNNPKIKSALKIMALLLILLMAPLWLAGAVVMSFYVLARVLSPKPYQIFARDLCRGLQQGGVWNVNDIIFIPTCFATEIRAIGEFLNDWPENKTLPQFHLLFRTNVFGGFSNNYRDQLSGNLDFRQSFKWISGTHPDVQLHYYTDTPQLSAQYKVLSDLDFKVLPVPVPWTVSEDQNGDPSGKPINIVYVGDVRDEKGYYHYPKIIDALWEEYIANDKIKFTLQSNFADNLDVSRESAIAQSLLQSYPTNVISHIKGPLDSAEYKALIDDADIVLLTYKPDHYRARSSGIFIEALKAGKAVLMPSMTWMSSEIEAMRQGRWIQAIQNKVPLKIVNGREWNAGQKIDIPRAGWIAIEFNFSVNKDEDLFAECAVFNVSSKNKDLILSDAIRVAQIDKNGHCTIMLNTALMNDDVYIQYKIHGGEAVLLDAKIYVSDTPWKSAEDFAAAIYSYADEKYMIRTLRELIDNIAEYKTDARSFAIARGQEFTPDTLVERLLLQAGHEQPLKRLVA